MFERGADERGHLADQPAAAGGELEPVQVDRQIQLVGEVAPERLSDSGLLAEQVENRLDFNLVFKADSRPFIRPRKR